MAPQTRVAVQRFLCDKMCKNAYSKTGLAQYHKLVLELLWRVTGSLFKSMGCWAFAMYYSYVNAAEGTEITYGSSGRMSFTAHW